VADCDGPKCDDKKRDDLGRLQFSLGKSQKNTCFIYTFYFLDRTKEQRSHILPSFLLIFIFTLQSKRVKVLSVLKGCFPCGTSVCSLLLKWLHYGHYIYILL
jgi:hypothetical protein